MDLSILSDDSDTCFSTPILVSTASQFGTLVPNLTSPLALLLLYCSSNNLHWVFTNLLFCSILALLVPAMLASLMYFDYIQHYLCIIYLEPSLHYLPQHSSAALVLAWFF